MEFEVVTVSGASAGKVELPDSVFKVKPGKHTIYEAVKCYMANQRLGTASAKTRSEVKASGRKPWRQKGLGRARAGTAGSPIWVGGGVAHGPRPKDYYYSLPKSERRHAIRSALSIKAGQGGIKVVESLGVGEPKTKLAVEMMKAVGVHRTKCLFVLPGRDDNMVKAVRNIPGARTTIAKDVNIYDVMNSENLVIDKKAVATIVEVLAR